MDIYLIMHDPHLKFYISIENIVVEETVSQIFDIDFGSFSHKI